MVDFKVTIRKIHNKLPELDIDSLLDIMDCITELSIIKYPKEENDEIFNQFMKHNTIKGGLA